MSNPSLDTIISYLAIYGFTPDLIAVTPDSTLASLTGPNGIRLNQIQIVAIKTRCSQMTVQFPDKLHVGEIGTLNEKKLQALRISQQSLSEVNARVSDLASIQSNLDICFCIDGTGSMASLIDRVKQSIVQVSYNIENATGMKPRFALVVYRDYSDSALRHQFWDFTSSESLSLYLASLAATGGDDEPEDCFGGLWVTTQKLTWLSPARLILWMGDSPQHGNAYNGGAEDDYPDADPDGITATRIFSEFQRLNISLVFCKLTESTNAMIEKLKQEVVPYGANLLREFNVMADMASFLTKIIYTTTSCTTSCGYRAIGPEKAYKLTIATWWINELWCAADEPAEVFSFVPYTGGNLHPLLDLLYDGSDLKPRTARVRMTINPYERGEMRLAYLAKVTNQDGQEMYGVTKESRFEGPHNSKEVVAGQAHMQAVAGFLASDFTQKLGRLYPGYEFKYVPVELVRFLSRPSGKNYFSLETFLNGNFVKYNNNSGFVDKWLEMQNPIPQAFSHFTYCYSKGILMVTDLQGVIDGRAYCFTDPAIHTANPEKLLSDPTNLGTKGMSAFFSSHVCNSVCSDL